MSAAWEAEAATIAASDTFKTDPASIINSLSSRAITAHFMGQRGAAKHMTWVAARLIDVAANPHITAGASLGSLIGTYGHPGVPEPMTIEALGDEPPPDDAPLPKRARNVRR